MSNRLATSRVGRNETICEVHRKIYWALAKSDCSRETKKEIENLLQKAFVMGKKMGTKLTQYFKGKDINWYRQHREDGATFEEYMEGPE